MMTSSIRLGSIAGCTIRTTLPLLALAFIQAGCGGSRAGGEGMPNGALTPTPGTPAPEVQEPTPAGKSVWTLMTEHPDLTTFVQLAKAAGVSELLGGLESVTVLAPTDEAFAELPPSMIESLIKPGSKAGLLAVLRNHVFPGALTAEDLLGLEETPANTLGLSLPIAADGDGFTVNGARLLEPNLGGSDGVVHVIDEVLLP